MESYKTLLEYGINCDKNCDFDTAKSIYKKIIINYHPDKGGDPKIFMKLHKAYEDVILNKCVIFIDSIENDMKEIELMKKFKNDLDNNTQEIRKDYIILLKIPEWIGTNKKRQILKLPSNLNNLTSQVNPKTKNQAYLDIQEYTKTYIYIRDKYYLGKDFEFLKIRDDSLLRITYTQ